MTTITWRGTVTATSSITHGGETRGTITLLRRELVLTPDGHPIHVPIISGNGFRGLLRRTGEELLREALDYAGELSLPIAHALRSGGSLAKTSREPLSGRRLATLRHLVPHIGVFGCAGGGRIIDGCLQVGKVVPHLTETRHLLSPTPRGDLLTAFNATQLETYVRQDDADTHAFTDLHPTRHVPVHPTTAEPDLDALAADEPDSQLMLYRIETFPAGTRFTTWLRLAHATDLEAAFFTDVLEHYTANARLGGRSAIGHGSVTLDLTPSTDQDPRDQVDWRAHVTANRTQALDAMEALQ